mmetsp:Transcript_34418/g.64158  ORF Transcript_34418/g.64158 Transcript_34418/m.64158 type:complete len:107 (-) Transcript_34418:541-861(-)
MTATISSSESLHGMLQNISVTKDAFPVASAVTGSFTVDASCQLVVLPDDELCDDLRASSPLIMLLVDNWCACNPTIRPLVGDVRACSPVMVAIVDGWCACDLFSKL